MLGAQKNYYHFSFLLIYFLFFGGGVVVFILDFSFDFCLYDFAIMYSAIYSLFCFIYSIDQKKLCCSLKHNANNIFKQIAN